MSNAYSMSQSVSRECAIDDEMLAAILDPLDRTAEAARRERDEIILRIELAARAEAAADIVFDVVHRLLGQLHHRGHGALVEERQLGRARHRQPLVALVPFGEQTARLHRAAPSSAARGTCPRWMWCAARNASSALPFDAVNTRGAVSRLALEQLHLARFRLRSRREPAAADRCRARSPTAHLPRARASPRAPSRPARRHSARPRRR